MMTLMMMMWRARAAATAAASPRLASSPGYHATSMASVLADLPRPL